MSKMNESRIIQALSDSRKSKYSQLRENYVGEDPLVGQVDQIVPVDPGEAEVVTADDLEVEFDPDYEETSDDDWENDTAGEDDMFDDNDEFVDYDVTEDEEIVDDEVVDLADLTDEELEELLSDIEDELADREAEIDAELDVECDPELDTECDPVDENEAGKISFAGGKKHKITQKQLRLAKKKKKGYKLVNGKRVKMSAKQKRALAKNAKKLHRGSAAKRAAKRRAKTMRANASVDFDQIYANENAFLTLINGVITDFFNESSEDYAPFEVISVNEGTVRGNKFFFECTARYADGEETEATFVLTGRPDGYYDVTESNDVFDAENIEITGTYHMNGNKFVFDTMGYRMDTGDEIVTESFRVINEK